MLFSYNYLPAIFIHIPKTGGNTLTQAIFERGLSLDKMTISGHQDGVNRFGVTGKCTSRKHNTLSEYFKYNELYKLKIFTCVRRPVQRLISLYFSPHRSLMSETNDLKFNIDAFYELIKKSRSCLDFLSISNHRMSAIPSNLIIIRTESLAADSKRFLRLNISNIRNRSNQKELQKELALDSKVLDIVQNSHHHQDEFFSMEGIRTTL